MPSSNLSGERRELRRAFEEWVRGLDFPWFLTLNINAPASYRSARRLLKRFAARLDRQLLGPRFSKRKATRTLFIAVPEHEKSNFHYHVLLCIKARGKWTMQDLEKLMMDAWAAEIASGSVWLRGVHDRGAARYTAKDLLKYGHFDEFIISTEFHSS